MNLFTPAELVANYAALGAKKAKQSARNLCLLGLLAGLLIALGGAVAQTATFDLTSVSVTRLVSGLLFPFGLGMVIVVGAELFTGNCLIIISVADKQATAAGMLRNWLCVYLANFAGALLVAAGCALFGQLHYGGGALALTTMRAAAAKCALPFWHALVSGIFCNVLVSLGVLMSLAAKDVPGRIMGAYLPVAFFVICGFEHSVANMYYIPAGLFAASVPTYAAAAVSAGLDLSALTVPGFLLGNLLPVTLGNILGGMAVGLILYTGHRSRPST